MCLQSTKFKSGEGEKSLAALPTFLEPEVYERYSQTLDGGSGVRYQNFAPTGLGLSFDAALLICFH